MDKAEVYARLIRSLLLQYDGLETGLKAVSKDRSPHKTEGKAAYSPVSAKEDDPAVTGESRVTWEQSFYGLTPGEISDVFERDARRYDGG